MVHVKKMPGQSDDALIKSFQRKVIESGVVQEAKDRRFHLTRAERKKLDEQNARRMRRHTV